VREWNVVSTAHQYGIDKVREFFSEHGRARTTDYSNVLTIKLQDIGGILGTGAATVCWRAAYPLHLLCYRYSRGIPARKGCMAQETKQYRAVGTRRVAVVSALIFLGLTLLDATSLYADEAMTLTLASSAFEDRGSIPAKYTCEGEDIAPPLKWLDVPNAARSLVLIVDDPDAPDPKAPKMTWVHWVLYNIPPDVSELVEDVTSESLPPGTQEGVNDWKRVGYGGPCPPIGRHRYFHKLYALDTVLDGMNRPTKEQLEAAMKGHVIAQAQIVGNYQKSSGPK
jgi:Raf kinase inhibitor-like YbhB/YbcL family protein